jgi:hypothetical protein
MLYVGLLYLHFEICAFVQLLVVCHTSISPKSKSLVISDCSLIISPVVFVVLFVFKLLVTRAINAKDGK